MADGESSGFKDGRVVKWRPLEVAKASMTLVFQGFDPKS